MIKVILAGLFLFTPFAFAQSEHTLIRRITVFPIKVPLELQSVAEDTWWDLREVMTREKRFLVASKNFLQQKDVFQARGPLSPADAIILGKILDANALMTIALDERNLSLRVYEGEYGRTLWEHTLLLQPSLPIAEQLHGAVIKLAQDFVAAIPYQGYVILDSLRGQALYKEGRRIYVKAEVGTNSEVELGDAAQLVRVSSDNLKPLFTNGPTIEVLAEGRIVERDQEHVTIELDRLNRAAKLDEGTLVRLPRELKHLEQQYALKDGLKNKIDPEFYTPSMTSAKVEEAEKRPLVASLAFIANLAAFLLLAF